MSFVTSFVDLKIKETRKHSVHLLKNLLESMIPVMQLNFLFFLKGICFICCFVHFYVQLNTSFTEGLFSTLVVVYLFYIF